MKSSPYTVQSNTVTRQLYRCAKSASFLCDSTRHALPKPPSLSCCRCQIESSFRHMHLRHVCLPVYRSFLSLSLTFSLSLSPSPVSLPCSFNSLISYANQSLLASAKIGVSDLFPLAWCTPGGAEFHHGPRLFLSFTGELINAECVCT